jgi:Fe-S-cluster containining protein
MKPFKEYLQLRNELDARCAELYALHAPHLNCEEGCDMCCMDFSIFPLEVDAIKAQAGEALKNGVTPAAEGECPFLVNHSCVIYPARPMICRTQGLPLLYMGEENWELSTCELNFTDFDFDEFTQENTFPQDRFNSRLFMLNKKYIETLPGRPYKPTDLIPLRQLFEEYCIE